MNVTPVSATVFATGLVMVNVMTEVPFTAIGFVPNDLTMDGGATTVVDALAVLPVPPFAEETLPVVLFLSPAVIPVTVTLNVQLPFAAIEPPVRAIVFGAVTVNVPPHCALVALVTVKPAGRVSVKATFVRAVLVFGFVMVKLKVVVPFNGIVAAPNDFEIEGGATTVVDALAVLPVQLLRP